MRKLFSLLAVLVLISFTPAETPLSKKDRKFALNYLSETKQRLINNVNGLSDAQLNWKPADSVWSVADCIEHIALAEKNLFDWSMGSLKEPADSARRNEVKQTDQSIIKMITDRSFKAKAPEDFIPGGQFGTAQDALKVFIERRNNTQNFFKTTQEDLRNHFIAHPFLGTIDTYQMLLFLNGHTLRHTLQLEELKANPNFPKK
ncbi:MAG: DinB family protein [Chitinophagaceae bacterium]